MRIADEGKAKRAEAEQSLVKMEGDLKTALASARAKATGMRRQRRRQRLTAGMAGDRRMTRDPPAAALRPRRRWRCSRSPRAPPPARRRSREASAAIADGGSAGAAHRRRRAAAERPDAEGVLRRGRGRPDRQRPDAPRYRRRPTCRSPPTTWCATSPHRALRRICRRRRPLRPQRDAGAAAPLGQAGARRGDDRRLDLARGRRARPRQRRRLHPPAGAPDRPRRRRSARAATSTSSCSSSNSAERTAFADQVRRAATRASRRR